jgi:hypothetical protein
MQLRNILLALVLFAMVAAPAAAITFEFLTLPTNTLAGFDLTYDGSRGAVNFNGQIYLLDAAGNFTLINTLAPPSAGKTSISGDGTTIVTNTLDESGFGIPVIMRESEGWVPHLMETPPGYERCDYSRASAYDVNGDGTKVTGLLWDACAAKAFLWTEATGMQDLGPTRGTTISQDGTVIGGFNHSQRRPAYWPIEGNIGLDSVLLHHEEDMGEVFDISTNGQVLVGTGLPYGYDPILTGYQAFRYEMGDTNFTLLGTMSGSPNDISKALFIADNGVIIGVSGPSSINVKSFIWTPMIGMTSLKQYLVDAGVTELTNAHNLTWPKAFSEDGSTFIGEYIDLYGGWGYYRVNFGQTSPVQDVVRHTARLTDISPNPFNPMTTVTFSLDKRQNATVTVYDIAGRKVDVLADGEFQAGDHQLVWRGKDLSGREVSSGSYIVRLESSEGADSRTISLVR